MSDIYDLIKTAQMIQQIVQPLKPAIEQVQQLGQTGAIDVAQTALSTVAVPQILNMQKQGMFDCPAYRSGLSTALQVQAKTKEVKALQEGVLGDASAAVNEYVRQMNKSWQEMMGLTSIVQRSMNAQNIAILKFVPDYYKYDLPYGVKTTVRKLSKKAAKRVAEAEDLLYDTKDRKFYHAEEPEKKVEARTITVIASSIELFADITVPQLILFISKLVDNKTFAVNHPVGKHIYEIIQSWNTFIDFDCDVFYHARPIEGEEKPYHFYLEQDMLKAPPYISSHGRFNEIGSSCYYFADTKEGAINEIKKHCSSKTHAIEVAEIKPKRSIKMIDLSEAGLSKRNNFIDYIRLAASDNSDKIKKEYLLPNFVAACCREAGIEGIKYYSSGYNCYVIWQDDYFSFVDFDVVDI
ncbi:RES family NAD+ phosphorylase [Kineothrix sp. MSJ-39]|uniref:RES domain-containing protein n=1 Tax=Kineothrix sp. MSJ-39 TaxID=2841533 RepID=UPI001C100303|nr:RES domain-containing protein [Kineothrix sp. MSJ-39]MBU5430320.1 RES family NAD+ phosphorylase [Kineothrix sp. MSJ-39]